MILHFGGAKLYRAAAPLFMGLIVGEILASAFWSLASALLAALSMEVIQVPIQPQ